MGNCIETSSHYYNHHHHERVHASSTFSSSNHHHQQQKQPESGEETASAEEVGGGIRVKILLTKAELQWLMFRLQNSKGEIRRLEEILEEIERARSTTTRNEGWKPSLESITEGPAAAAEFLQMEDR